MLAGEADEPEELEELQAKEVKEHEQQEQQQQQEQGGETPLQWRGGQTSPPFLEQHRRVAGAAQ